MFSRVYISYRYSDIVNHASPGKLGMSSPDEGFGDLNVVDLMRPNNSFSTSPVGLEASPRSRSLLCKCLAWTGFLTVIIFCESCYYYYYISVSYTHLDVYKRQL